MLVNQIKSNRHWKFNKKNSKVILQVSNIKKINKKTLEYYWNICYKI